MSALENVQFAHVGQLPASEHPWHIKTGIGRVWFVNQDHPPMCIVDGALVLIVKADDHPDAPLVTPASGAPSSRTPQ